MANTKYEGQQWLRWWTQTYWQQADAGWHHLPFFKFDEAIRHQLALTHHAAVATLLDVPDVLPGNPDLRIMTLIDFSSTQRRLMMLLTGQICQGSIDTEELDNDNRIWCQRISRALRPGIWLPPSLCFSPDPQPAALVLLAAIFPSESWFRLRLSFDHQAVMSGSEIQTALPLSKLQALWDAVIWRSKQGMK